MRSPPPKWSRRHGEPWTDEEDQHLLVAVTGRSRSDDAWAFWGQLANELGRTPVAIQARLCILRFAERAGRRAHK